MAGVAGDFRYHIPAWSLFRVYFHRFIAFTISADRKTRVAVGCQPLLQMAEISLPFSPTDTLIIRTGDLGVLGTASGKF